MVVNFILLKELASDVGKATCFFYCDTSKERFITRTLIDNQRATPTSPIQSDKVLVGRVIP